MDQFKEIQKTFVSIYMNPNVYNLTLYVNVFIKTCNYLIEYVYENHYTVLWFYCIFIFLLVISSDKYYTRVFNNFEKHFINNNKDKKELLAIVSDLSKNIDEFSDTLSDTVKNMNFDNMNKKIKLIQNSINEIKQQNTIEKTRLTKFKNNTDENLSLLYLRVKKIEDLIEGDPHDDDIDINQEENVDE